LPGYGAWGSDLTGGLAKVGVVIVGDGAGASASVGSRKFTREIEGAPAFIASSCFGLVVAKVLTWCTSVAGLFSPKLVHTNAGW